MSRHLTGLVGNLRTGHHSEPRPNPTEACNAVVVRDGNSEPGHGGPFCDLRPHLNTEGRGVVRAAGELLLGMNAHQTSRCGVGLI